MKEARVAVVEEAFPHLVRYKIVEIFDDHGREYGVKKGAIIRDLDRGHEYTWQLEKEGRVWAWFRGVRITNEN